MAVHGDVWAFSHSSERYSSQNSWTAGSRLWYTEARKDWLVRFAYGHLINMLGHIDQCGINVTEVVSNHSLSDQCSLSFFLDTSGMMGCQRSSTVQPDTPDNCQRWFWLIANSGIAYDAFFGFRLPRTAGVTYFLSWSRVESFKAFQTEIFVWSNLFGTAVCIHLAVNVVILAQKSLPEAQILQVLEGTSEYCPGGQSLHSTRRYEYCPEVQAMQTLSADFAVPGGHGRQTSFRFTVAKYSPSGQTCFKYFDSAGNSATISWLDVMVSPLMATRPEVSKWLTYNQYLSTGSLLYWNVWSGLFSMRLTEQCRQQKNPVGKHCDRWVLSVE